MIENILELAYIKDPKLFERDSNTRRSKPRQDLKTETGATLSYSVISTRSLAHLSRMYVGWGDEQIEGWKIMLDRNVSLLSLSYLILILATYLALDR